MPQRQGIRHRSVRSHCLDAENLEFLTVRRRNRKRKKFLRLASGQPPRLAPYNPTPGKSFSAWHPDSLPGQSHTRKSATAGYSLTPSQPDRIISLFCNPSRVHMQLECSRVPSHAKYIERRMNPCDKQIKKWTL